MGVLQNNSQTFSQILFFYFSDINSVIGDFPPTNIIKSIDQVGDCLLYTSSDILITSYDLLRRDIDSYKKYHFRHQIIDEAQYIKNHTTQAAKAVKKIQADTRFALTGTPVENRLSELWSIFDYLMPGFLYSYTRFRAELEQPIVQHDSEDCLLYTSSRICVWRAW